MIYLDDLRGNPVKVGSCTRSCNLRYSSKLLTTVPNGTGRYTDEKRARKPAK